VVPSVSSSQASLRTISHTSCYDGRYNDRLPASALDGAEFAPDQVPDAAAHADASNPNQTISRRASTIGGARSPAALWREDDSEGFYDRTKVESPRGMHYCHLSVLEGLDVF
jgi:hypothetical protein